MIALVVTAIMALGTVIIIFCAVGVFICLIVEQSYQAIRNYVRNRKNGKSNGPGGRSRSTKREARSRDAA